ncbi:MAG: hypothetical protein II737_05660, partial [Mailhella sp.]|nr:hypothetical protein [Mailhella sp.]
NIQLQNGRTLSYAFALQGDALILDGQMRLMRQPMPGQQPGWGQPPYPQQPAQPGWGQQPQQPQQPGWGQPQQPQQPGWNQPQQQPQAQPGWGQQPAAQPGPLTGRWASAANSSKMYLVQVFTGDLCISYLNGEELERSRYTYANGRLTQHMLTGRAAGQTLVWNCQVNGNRMVISGSGLKQPTVWLRQR